MSVYSQVAATARPFLGPATDKFLERQCKYLKISPEDLKKEHLTELAWLSKNAASAIMDPTQADKLAKMIESA
jgi:hypothetical protein